MATNKMDKVPPEWKIIVIPLKTTFLYAKIDGYPQYETKRPMKNFYWVEESKRIAVLDSIASQVVHIVIDPLDCSVVFLEMVKQKCVYAKRLTLDANLKDLATKMYIKNVLKNDISKANNAEGLCQKVLTFVGDFNQIEELYLGTELRLIDNIYDTGKWGFSRRFNENAKFYKPTFSSEIISNLNSNLSVIFFGDAEMDPYDLRDMGHACPVVIKAMPLSQPAQLEKIEKCAAHVCLNQLTSLKVLSISYFAVCYHSDTVEELILKTLSGDYNVHRMFPNLKKLTVKMFCPFVLDMSGTPNAGLYDGVVLDELEIEEQIPCFCSGMIQTSDDALLQKSLLDGFRRTQSTINSTKPKPHKTCTHEHPGELKYVHQVPKIQVDPQTECICTDVASISLFKSLKTIKIRCFDETVARFIRKLKENGNTANNVLYEKSRFERNSDHHSIWDNLEKLSETLAFVPHDKIEIVMRKSTGNKLRKIKAKLTHFIPEDVKISFTD